MKAQRHRSSSFPAPFAFAPFQPSHDSNNNRRPSSAVSLQELHGGFWASSKLCGDAERDDGSSGYDAVKPKSCENNLISYVRLTAFTRSATTDLARTLKQQVDRGTSLIVLDLRNNYGGIIQDAMVDASMFLANHPDTVLCYTVGPRGYAVHDVAEWLWSGSLLDQVQRQAGWEPPTNSPDSAPTASISIVPDSVPVAILVNEGTASAAEMFTAALQENGRATVLGTRCVHTGIVVAF
jgi:C-terminal processing protease CtpA/Prc